MPVLGFFYLIMPEIFSDKVAQLEGGKMYLVPSEGIPTWFSAFYAVNSLLWGDYTYLDMNMPLEINFFQFVQVWFWSAFMLSTSVLSFIPLLVWSTVGMFTLFNILWYDVAFVTHDPNKSQDNGKPILPPAPDDAEWI